MYTCLTTTYVCNKKSPADGLNLPRAVGGAGVEEDGQPPGAGKWHPHHDSTGSGMSMRTCAPHLQRTRSLLMYSKCPASTYNDIGVLVFSDPNQVSSVSVCSVSM